jgi:hypothetical protein
MPVFIGFFAPVTPDVEISAGANAPEAAISTAP